MPHSGIMRAKGRTVLFVLCASQALSVSAWAGCRVTDFTDRPITSLQEVERLSFFSQMSQTEFDKLKAAPAAPEASILANSPDLMAARAAARERVKALKIDHYEEYMRIWSTSFLTDEQIRDWTTCTSKRQPGLIFGGRWAAPGRFHVSFTHLTPNGIEKIRLNLLASGNVSNHAEIREELEGLGAQNTFTARTIPVAIADTRRPALLVVRAGWETPAFIHIPAPAFPPASPQRAAD